MNEKMNEYEYEMKIMDEYERMVNSDPYEDSMGLSPRDYDFFEYMKELEEQMEEFM